MKTTIAKHLLCLMLLICYGGLFGQENLAMNEGPYPDQETNAKKDTLQDQSKKSFSNKFNIYKNQTTCAIHVVAKDIEEGAYTFEIIDLNGDRIYNEVVNLSRNHYKIIDTSLLPKDSYYLIIRSGTTHCKKKISI